MKQLIAIAATVLAVSAFAAEPAKAPVATPAVTKADIPATAVVKAEVAKAPATKSPAKEDNKKAAPATATAPVKASSK